MVNNKKCIKLNIDDSFYNEEKRCGYIITKNQKKIWAVQLDLLNELLKVCNDNDIKVCVFAGTLLGAIRHNGFIPWDDDIDVCLDRFNYDKLVCCSKEFEYPYFFQTSITDSEFFIGYARLRNCETTCVVEWEKSCNYNSGIYIDIFVMDGLIDDYKLFKRQIKKRNLIEKEIECFHWERSKGIKRIIKKFLIKYFLKDYKKIIEKYDACISEYTIISNRLTMMTHNYELLLKYWCYKEDIDEIVYVPFENIIVPIPKNYNRVLSNIYGNYMEFPPVEERGEWHKDILYFDPDISYKEYYKLNEII